MIGKKFILKNKKHRQISNVKEILISGEASFTNMDVYYIHGYGRYHDKNNPYKGVIPKDTLEFDFEEIKQFSWEKVEEQHKYNCSSYDLFNYGCKYGGK